jgi:hypothetical protein
MKTFLSSNLCLQERGSRYFVGALLIASVMAQLPGVPVWVALLAVYPIGTAIMAWDPLFALLETLRQRIEFSFDGLSKGNAEPAS